MKKIILFLLVVSASFAMNAQTAPALVISEIMYNNPGAGNDSLEYVELYNRGTAAVSMKNFYFKNAFKDTFPDVSIAAGKFYVVCVNSTFFKQKMGFDANHQWKQGALNNTGETIELWTATGVLVDSARYSAAAPWPAQANGGGSSLVICDLKGSNDNQTDWTACTVAANITLNGTALFVTPNAINCNGAAALSATNDVASTAKNTAVKIAVLKNDIATKPITIASVTAPTNGTAVINSKKDTITYTPNKDYCGTDNFKYTMTDGTGSSTATVTINMTGCTPAGYPIVPISQLKATDAVSGAATELGKSYEITGVVNSPNFRPAGLEFDLIDNNAGVIVYNAAKQFKYTVKEGDKITVRGKVDQFNGLIQMAADTVFKTGTGTLFTTKVVSKLDESTEALIVKIKSVTLVDATKWTTGVGTGGFTVDVTDGKNTFSVRIDKDIDLYNQAAPTGKLNITGVGYQFDSAAPLLEGYQLYPRYKADIEKATGTTDPSIAAAVSVYPNPVATELTLKMEKALTRVSIYNALGQRVWTINTPSDTEIVNTNNWEKGVYFVEFTSNEGNYTMNVVK